MRMSDWSSDVCSSDLQMTVKVAAQSTTLESYAWSEAVNAEALSDLVENEGVKAEVLPGEIVERMRVVTHEFLEQKATEDPAVKKVHDAFFAFKATWARWSDRKSTRLNSSH